MGLGSELSIEFWSVASRLIQSSDLDSDDWTWGVPFRMFLFFFVCKSCHCFDYRKPVLVKAAAVALWSVPQNFWAIFFFFFFYPKKHSFGIF